MNPLHSSSRFSVCFALGFRPFFSGAILAGLGMIPVWALAFAGLIDPPTGVAVVVWHAHEMLYGFVGAVIAGFLLTASQNWTGMRGVHGPRLAGLVGLWLIARVCAFLPAEWLFAYSIVDLAFYPLLGAALWPYLARREYSKHWIFFLFFALLFLANLLFHIELHGGLAGWFAASHSLAAHSIVAYLTVIGGRVIPFFTRSALGESAEKIRQFSAIEKTVLPVTLVFASIDFAGLAPMTGAGISQSGLTGLRAVIAILACAAHAIRLAGWHRPGIWSRPILSIVHLAYAWIPIAFMLNAVPALNAFAGGPYLDWNPRSVALHAFTAGAMGVFIYGMISRVALGHTGRPIRAAKVVVFGYILILLAALTRVAGPPLLHLIVSDPGAALAHYPDLILASGGAWTAAFLILAIVYLPVLNRPRVDGKEG